MATVTDSYICEAEIKPEEAGASTFTCQREVGHSLSRNDGHRQGDQCWNERGEMWVVRPRMPSAVKLTVDVDAIRRRATVANLGPCEAHRDDLDGGAIGYQVQQNGGEGDVIAQLADDEIPLARERAVFLAACPVDVPLLCDALLEATADRDEARAWVRKLTAAERVLTCVYCGEAYPPGAPDHGAEVLTDHVRQCVKHPMRAVEAEAMRLRGLVEEAIGHIADPGVTTSLRARILSRPS